MCRLLHVSASGFYVWHDRQMSVRRRVDIGLSANNDLVKRQFKTDGPDQLWIANATYIPTCAGTIYSAIVLDVWSHKIVGWAIGGSFSYAVDAPCLEYGVGATAGDAYDNAMAESVFATLKNELLKQRRLKSQSEAKIALFESIEGW